MVRKNPGVKKVGLALSGGFARGLAHIGVLNVFDKHGIPVDYISATSSGALIGAAYAAGVEAARIQEIAFARSNLKLIQFTFFRLGFVSSQPIMELIYEGVGDKTFDDLVIPMRMIATDILSGEQVILDRGSLAQAVAASAASPGVFAPVERNGRWLVDGGLTNNLPVDVVRQMGAEYVIAVDVIPTRQMSQMPKGPFQMYQRSYDILSHRLSVPMRDKADVIIDPSIDEEIYSFDVRKVKRLVAEGEMVASRLVEKIKQDLCL